MRRMARGSLGGTWVGTLLGFLTAGIVLPSESRAGCGSHYVTSRTGWQGASPGLELLTARGTVPADRGQSPFQRQTPCSGILCSGNPATPFPAPSLVRFRAESEWAVPSVLVALNRAHSFQRLPADEDLFPVDHICSIFRPPRSRALFVKLCPA